VIKLIFAIQSYKKYSFIYIALCFDLVRIIKPIADTPNINNVEGSGTSVVC